MEIMTIVVIITMHSSVEYFFPHPWEDKIDYYNEQNIDIKYDHTYSYCDMMEFADHDFDLMSDCTPKQIENYLLIQ